MNDRQIDKYITCNPDVLLGKPIIRGTRIPVYLIVGFTENGMTPAEIVDDYPHLTIDEVQAAIAFGTMAIEHGHNLEATGNCSRTLELLFLHNSPD